MTLDHQIVLTVPDLPEAMEYFTNRLGFRLAMILPADEPHTALLSGQGITLRLEAQAAAQPETAQETFIISRLPMKEAWHEGRAGMQYRDLIPSRLGGRFIASHIRIPDGGPVADYVHYHKIRFQMIYCKTGWVRVVYEDQGPPFVLEAGDCVLQPPEIRHRVLEASPGLEVIEVSSPAIHETWVDHELQLPTSQVLPNRLFSGQRFVRHQAKEAQWLPWRSAGFEVRDTGIADATNGLATARVVRATTATQALVKGHTGEFQFIFVLAGEVAIDWLSQPLQVGDSCVIPAQSEYNLQASAGAELMEVALPA
ncbi:MAG: cupin [Blastocatellia bacterium]|nr:cupin [Blastocatellia bacterium]